MAVGMRTKLHPGSNKLLDFLLIHMQLVTDIPVDDKERALGIIFLQ